MLNEGVVYITRVEKSHIEMAYLFPLLFIVFFPLTRVSAEKVVLAYVDGLGVGHAFRGGLPTDGSRWTRSSVESPAGDSALVASMLSTGCDELLAGGISSLKNGGPADKLRQVFGRSGASYGLVTSKCVDDGTSSPFVASWPDRYDLFNVALKISGSRPTPEILSGGFSRNLWSAAASNASTFIEFASGGSKAFAETCEYPASASFAPRSVDALERLAAASSSFLLVLVFTGVDTASHKGTDGGGGGLDEQLSIIKKTLSAVEARLEEQGGVWKMVVVGSHDTGGALPNGTLTHARHSPAGTLVPLFTRGVPALEVARTSTMAAVAKLVSPKLICSLERSATARDFVYTGSARRERVTAREEVAFFWTFFMAMTAVAVICFVVSEENRRG